MADAVFRHGHPVMVDYTPAAGDVAAGDMVLIGNLTGLTVGVAHSDISNTVLGALAAGGGVYSCQLALASYTAGTLVYKPEGNAILTTTTTNNAPFGFTLEAAAANNGWAKVLHHPYVPA